MVFLSLLAAVVTAITTAVLGPVDNRHTAVLATYILKQIINFSVEQKSMSKITHAVQKNLAFSSALTPENKM